MPFRHIVLLNRRQTCLTIAGLALGAWVFSGCQKAPESKTAFRSLPSPTSSPTAPTPNPAQALSPPTQPSTTATTSLSEEETVDPIGDVLSADLTPGETTSRLLTLLPSTPADDQSFLVQIAGNYCPDEEYWRMLPFLLNRNLPEGCREELLRDVLRRPDAVRLRPLYRLALDPTHPLSQEAKEYLFSYLQDVPENDFHALARAVDQAEREAP